MLPFLDTRIKLVSEITASAFKAAKEFSVSGSQFSVFRGRAGYCLAGPPRLKPLFWYFSIHRAKARCFHRGAVHLE
jgi:hypothetical protein